MYIWYITYYHVICKPLKFIGVNSDFEFPQCFTWYIEFACVTIKLNEPVFLISTKSNYFILMQQFLPLAYYSSIYEDTDTKERRN